MKKNALIMTLVFCVVLAAALLFSVVSLARAHSEIDALTAQVEALQTQLQAQPQAGQSQDANPDEDGYFTFIADTWDIVSNQLTVTGYAYAVLPAGSDHPATLELRLGSDVVASQSVMLTQGEAEGVFEADLEASFPLPTLGADDLLQLWLVVDTGSGTRSACGAEWYLDGTELMLIAG